VRRVLPDPVDDLDDDMLAAAYDPATASASASVPAERPFVRCNMISSLDGAISVDGRSGALGGPGDRRVFATLRAWADVIVVGAGTVRAEHYGPARLGDDAQRRRAARGQPPQPPIAVVTTAGVFDYGTPFFTDATARPLVVTTEQGAARVANDAGDRADVVAAGTDTVDLAAAFAALHARGARSVLVEGGPGLNGDLARAGLLDELCLTLAPRIVGGDGPRLVAGAPIVPPYLPRPRHMLEEDGFLFLRLTLTLRPEG
jgi:riboflavin biosynthesis pyrimidine reductase